MGKILGSEPPEYEVGLLGVYCEFGCRGHDINYACVCVCVHIFNSLLKVISSVSFL